MDIRNWGIGRIMQLPDWCFGRRFEVVFADYASTNVQGYYISEMALPDVCVLWEFGVYTSAMSAGLAHVESYYAVGLSDDLPAAIADMVDMEPLIQGVDERVLGNRVMRGSWTLRNLRKPIMAQGRRVAAMWYCVAGSPATFNMHMVFSGIPTEVPDWLVRGRGHQEGKW